MSTRTETGIAALVLGFLVLIVAASFNVWSIEQLIVPDKQLQGAASIAAIALCQTSCLVLAMWLLIRRPELKASLPILLIGALLTTASSIGVYGSYLAWSPKPWKAPGVPMVERLRLLEEQSWMYPNEVGIEKYRRLLRLPIFSNSVSLRFNHGVALLEEGRTLAAIDVFRQLMRESAGKEGEKKQHSVIRDWLAIAHLRRGEQANCIERHSADVCIFPIRSSGVHVDPTGSTSAITELKATLSEKPRDLNSRWLLNIAYMTLGKYPQEVPKQWLIPPSAFQSEFDIGRFKDVAPQLGVAVRTMAGGSIVEDFNGDGLLDIFTSSTGHHENLNYFQNQGDGTFSDRTHAAGLSGQTGGLNLAQADYDNDGAIDVLVARGAWRGFMPGNGDAPNSLLRNNGDGTFTDVTEESGLLSFHPTQVATWADFDNDGWVDIFLGNESQPGDPHPVQLYRNNRGTFEEVSGTVGLNISGMVKGAAWEDYDNDGYPDLYISRQGQPNLLFHNGSGKGSKRLFKDVTLVAGVAKPRYSFPTWFFDYDNDGWQDLFVAGFGSAPRESDPPPLLAPSHRYLGDVAAEYLQLPASSSPTPRLYHNNQDGTFTDVTSDMSLDRARFVMGANFGDLDNDGYLDLYLGTGDPNYRALMPNRMFRSDKGRNFQDVTSSGGFGHLQKGHGIAFGDLDNDGDQDIYAQMGGWYRGDAYQNVLFRNPGHGNNWITLRLRGVRSNAAAIGARISLTARNAQGKRNIYIAVGTGGSFGASSLQQEIGLGAATAIERLEIYWPVTGLTQTFEDIQMNRIISIREDSDTPAIISRGLE
ncbi:MAG: CRTAC1 family protein [Halioglobus sp.]